MIQKTETIMILGAIMKKREKHRQYFIAVYSTEYILAT